MYKILLIIPAFNEESNIVNTVNKILQFNKDNKTNYDVIVVNDGSSDNTAKICDDNNIPYLNLIQNLGIGSAVQAGLKYANKHNYDIAVQYDGDGQHDVNYVKNVCQPIIDKKANLVIGSRFIDKTSSKFKSSGSRRMGINIISFFIKLLSRKKIYDTTSGFRAMDKNIIKTFSSNYPIEYPEPISTFNAIKQKFKIEEVPVSMNERQGGVSSITSWKSVYFMINVVFSLFIEALGGWKNEY